MSLEGSLTSWAGKKGYTEILNHTIVLWKETGQAASNWDGSVESAAVCLLEIARIAYDESRECAAARDRMEKQVEQHLKKRAECCEQLRITCSDRDEVDIQLTECRKLYEYYTAKSEELKAALRNARDKQNEYEEKIRYAAKWSWVPFYGTFIGIQALVEDYWAEISSLQNEYEAEENYLNDCVCRVRENDKVSTELKNRIEALRETEGKLDGDIKGLEQSISYYKNNEALLHAVSVHFHELSVKADSTSCDYDIIVEEMGCLLSMNEQYLLLIDLPYR